MTRADARALPPVASGDPELAAMERRAVMLPPPRITHTETITPPAAPDPAAWAPASVTFPRGADAGVSGQAPPAAQLTPAYPQRSGSAAPPGYTIPHPEPPPHARDAHAPGAQARPRADAQAPAHAPTPTPPPAAAPAAPRWPADIPLPDLEPPANYRLADSLGNAAYSMSVTFGVIGQISFLGPAFGHQWWSYAAAFALGGFLEASMVSAGQRSLKHRERDQPWNLTLIIGLFIGFYAAVTNVGHFWSKSPSMALMFGGASICGFLLHIVNGHIEVAAKLRRNAAKVAAHTAAVARAEQVARKEHNARVAALTAQAERATTEAATLRAAAAPPAPQPPDAPPPAPRTRTTPPASRSTNAVDELAQQRQKDHERDDLRRRVQEWSTANGTPGPARIRAHWEQNFRHEVHQLPTSERQLRRWANGGGRDLANAN